MPATRAFVSVCARRQNCVPVHAMVVPRSVASGREFQQLQLGHQGVHVLGLHMRNHHVLEGGGAHDPLAVPLGQIRQRARFAGSIRPTVVVRTT